MNDGCSDVKLVILTQLKTPLKSHSHSRAPPGLAEAVPGPACQRLPPTPVPLPTTPLFHRCLSGGHIYTLHSIMESIPTTLSLKCGSISIYSSIQEEFTNS